MEMDEQLLELVKQYRQATADMEQYGALEAQHRSAMSNAMAMRTAAEDHRDMIRKKLLELLG